MSSGQILLVGCGKMGGALLDGWLDRGLSPHDIQVIEPGPMDRRRPHVAVFDGPALLARDFDPAVVVLAVKPQAMDAVVPAYGAYSSAVFLSIAAGKKLETLSGLLGGDRAVVRAMPNTPAAVRRAMTVLVANHRVSEDQRRVCGDLMAAVGNVAWIEDEALMDAVTAVSGSGPAYVFLLAEALAQAGTAAGLPEGLAADLARGTVVGAAELLHQSTQAPESLRRNVTSPGGTTAAALELLMAEDGLAPLMRRAIAAATRRSRELAG